jgi:UDPglucose--hexose-1-phosphate uridylyltransferase
MIARTPETAIVVAPNRRGRPNDFHGHRQAARCPFCARHEADTEPTSWSDGDPWSIRAFPNKFPMLASDLALQEVIVETPAHKSPWETRMPAELERLLHALVLSEARVAAHPCAVQPVLWKNSGRSAGASLAHPHVQAIGLPYEADVWARTGERARASLADDLRERDVASDDRIAIVVPRVPRSTYEVRLVPRDVRAARLADWDAATRAAMADALVETFGRLAAVLGAGFDHNVLFHPECISVIPRGRHVSGIELAVGLLEVDLSPPEAAAALRSEKSRVRA